MEVVTLEDLESHNMVNKTSIAFLSTLFEMAGSFPIDGEQILNQYNGYRNYKWASALIEIAAGEGYFRRPSMRVEDAPTFAEIQPFITRELVADLCLADDLLKSLYYEHRVHRYQQQFMAMPKVPHEVRRRFKELRAARIDFCKQKAAYLRIAYRKRVPRKVYVTYDAESCINRFVGEIDLGCIFPILPVIFKLHPRDTAADASPISKTCRKYSHLLAFCDEAIASLSV